MLHMQYEMTQMEEEWLREYNKCEMMNMTTTLGIGDLLR